MRQGKSKAPAVQTQTGKSICQYFGGSGAGGAGSRRSKDQRQESGRKRRKTCVSEESEQDLIVIEDSVDGTASSATAQPPIVAEHIVVEDSQEAPQGNDNAGPAAISIKAVGSGKVLPGQRRAKAEGQAAKETLGMWGALVTQRREATGSSNGTK